MPDLSFNDIKELLRAALTSVVVVGPNDYLYIEDCFSDAVVYSVKGKFYKRSYAIDSEKKVTLGDATEVVEVSTYEPVVKPSKFSLAEFTETAGEVIYTGKLFELGEFPDKRFSLTEAEADLAISGFAGVSNDLEHVSTVLDGELGGVRQLWRQGKEIFGKVAIPKWLSEATGGKPLGTSLAWDRHTKKVVGNAITTQPRIEDALLMAAFSKRNDLAPSGTARTATAAATAGNPRTGGKSMKLREIILALFTGAGVDPEAEVDGSGIPVVQPGNTPPANFKAENDTLKAQLEAMHTARLDEAAAAFADDIIKVQHRALPSERDGLIASFKLAVKADADAAGTAVFSAAGQMAEGENLKAVKSQYAARKPHQLVGEKITAVEFKEASQEGSKNLMADAYANFNAGNGRAK